MQASYQSLTVSESEYLHSITLIPFSSTILVVSRFQIEWIWGAFQADPKVELNSHQQYIDSANKKAPSTVADIVVQHDVLGG